MPRAHLLVSHTVLAGLGLLLLALGASEDGHTRRAGAQAGTPVPHRAFLPGVACDGCSGPPPSPSPSATKIPTATATKTAASGFQIVFIDVGQGDATLITVNGQRLLIDAGRTGGFIAARLQTLGVTDLDAILATHPDADHIGGFPAVLGLYDVERIYLNGGTSDSQTFATFMNAVDAEDAQVTTLARGQSVALGGLQLPVLHPGVLTGDSNADSALRPTRRRPRITA